MAREMSVSLSSGDLSVNHVLSAQALPDACREVHDGLVLVGWLVNELS
jgi:hypothetical protein